MTLESHAMAGRGNVPRRRSHMLAVRPATSEEARPDAVLPARPASRATCPYGPVNLWRPMHGHATGGWYATNGRLLSVDLVDHSAAELCRSRSSTNCLAYAKRGGATCCPHSTVRLSEATSGWQLRMCRFAPRDRLPTIVALTHSGVGTPAKSRETRLPKWGAPHRVGQRLALPEFQKLRTSF